MLVRPWRHQCDGLCERPTDLRAHEGEEHETINGVVLKVDETAGKITLKMD
jgi:hypothetical protein